jgi:hypothetical protein
VSKAKTKIEPVKARAVTPAGDDGWLAVSTEGFREQNMGREPGHLIKELVQNGLDAVDGKPGSVSLTIKHDDVEGFYVKCEDTGCGIDDIEAIRTVFWTSKKDSPTDRGRMGRGFKELLSVARECKVWSKGQCLHFFIEKGKRKRKVSGRRDAEAVGAVIEAWVDDWDMKVVAALGTYFGTFLPPGNIKFSVNGWSVRHLEPTHVIDCRLPTEIFENSRWVKPSLATKVELIPCTDEHKEPTIFEMGIPVCPAEWDQPYHINVRQRIPMNPNRDAVASGFANKLHRVCLPTLINEMAPDQIKEDWVGEAVRGLDTDVQKQVITKGFGDNIVRSVPVMGGSRRDFDADAKEMGTKIVDTKHLSGGFREVIQQHVPTSREAVIQYEVGRIQQAAQTAFTVAGAYEREDQAAKIQQKMIERAGGRDRVSLVMRFAQWFATELLSPYGEMCNGVNIAPLKTETQNTKFGKPAIATWSSTGILTLGIDHVETFLDPFGEDSLRTHIHEAAHNRAHHHGDQFHEEVEVLAGRAASIMLEKGDEIRRQFGALFK